MEGLHKKNHQLYNKIGGLNNWFENYYPNKFMTKEGKSPIIRFNTMATTATA